MLSSSLSIAENLEAIRIWALGVFGLTGAVVVGGLALLGGYYLVAPDKAEIIVGQIARLFGWTGGVMRRRAVRGNVEGRLNLSRSALNGASPGLLPYTARVRWADAESVESFLKDDQVIVRMSYSDHPHRNLVLAALMYFRRGILPQSTQYLRKPMQHALALLMVDQMLSRARQGDSLNYFREEILKPDCDNAPELEDAFETLTKLLETGYFLRVFLPELTDYPLATLGAPPRSHHYTEITEFISYLRSLSQLVYIEAYLENRAGPAGLATLDFFRERIRASFVIVGRRGLVDSVGYAAHVNRLRWCRQQGCRIAYLTGSRYDWVFGVAREAEQKGIVEILEMRTVDCVMPDGSIVKRGYARLKVCQLPEIVEPPALPASDESAAI